MKAAANTLLTNENARILEHTIYEPSLLIFHGPAPPKVLADGGMEWNILKQAILYYTGNICNLDCHYFTTAPNCFKL